MKPETDSNVMSRCQCACPEVSLSPSRGPRADCLSVCVRGLGSACRCLSPVLPQLFVYAAGPGRQRRSAGSCHCICAPPKVYTLCLFCAPSLCIQGFLLSLLILDFILALTLFLTAVRDLWQAECGCLLKAGCSLTLLSGPISAPEGLLNCPRFSVRKRASKGQEARGWVVGRSNNACPNQISQEWISCVQTHAVKKILVPPRLKIGNPPHWKLH